MIVIADKISEHGSHSFLISFTDENDDAVTPNNAYWSLLNEEHDIVNSRDHVAIAPLTTTGVITIHGDDLDADDGTKREIVIEADIDSIYGGSLPQTEKILIDIETIPYKYGET
jgi:hypothetical protein